MAASTCGADEALTQTAEYLRKTGGAELEIDTDTSSPSTPKGSTKKRARSGSSVAEGGPKDLGLDAAGLDLEGAGRTPSGGLGAMCLLTASRSGAVGRFEGDDSDWDFLVVSRYHQVHPLKPVFDQFGDAKDPSVFTSAASGSPNAADVPGRESEGSKVLTPMACVTDFCVAVLYADRAS